ncbi:OmpA family protein [bacterium]|nr:OmpA family protein [bacterium]
MSRKKKHEEEENAERWLLTYADMITLLVAFFMMMYSMSVINLEKFKAAAIGIRSGFNGPSIGKKQSGDSMIERGVSHRPMPQVDIMAMPPISQKSQVVPQGKIAKRAGNRKTGMTAAQRRAKRVDKLSGKINKSLVGVTQGDAARVVRERKGVSIELVGDLIFFPKGTAQLNDEAENILLAVSGVLSSLANEVSIEGYTSPFTQEGNSHFRNSWELSTARAMAVVNFLMEGKKINPARVSVTGFGQYRPEKNSRGTTVAKNRDDRVRIFIYQD